MIFRVPVPRDLGFDLRHGLGLNLRCPLSQISGHSVANALIIGISPFRKKHDRPANERRHFVSALYFDHSDMGGFSWDSTREGVSKPLIAIKDRDFCKLLCMKV